MTDQTQSNQNQSGSAIPGGEQSTGNNGVNPGNMQGGQQSQGGGTSHQEPQVNFPNLAPDPSYTQSSQSQQSAQQSSQAQGGFSQGSQPQQIFQQGSPQSSQPQGQGAVFPQTPQTQEQSETYAQTQQGMAYQGSFQGSTPMQQGGILPPFQQAQGGFNQPQQGYQGAYSPPAPGYTNPQGQPGYAQTQPQGGIYPSPQGNYAQQPISPVQGGGFQQPLPGSGQVQGGTAQQEPPVDPSLVGYVFGEMNKNFKMNVKIPAHNLKFDEFYFLKLLAGSISLTKDEKWKIVQSVPKLRQEQVDELIRILEEEKEKFIELSPKHAAQLKKLEEQHLADWKDIEVREKQKTKHQQDEAKAAEIRKSLGLS